MQGRKNKDTHIHNTNINTHIQHGYRQCPTAVGTHGPARRIAGQSNPPHALTALGGIASTPVRCAPPLSNSPPPLSPCHVHTSVSLRLSLGSRTVARKEIASAATLGPTRGGSAASALAPLRSPAAAKTTPAAAGPTTGGAAHPPVPPTHATATGGGCRHHRRPSGDDGASPHRGRQALPLCGRPRRCGHPAERAPRPAFLPVPAATVGGSRRTSGSTRSDGSGGGSGGDGGGDGGGLLTR